MLVERSSRLVLLAKMDDATAASALTGFSAKLNSIAEPLRQSLTYDQGKEMTRHSELSANTGVKVYFCDPHSPWQRGTCENTNGLLRQYPRKGTDLSVHTQEELDARQLEQATSCYARVPPPTGGVRAYAQTSFSPPNFNSLTRVLHLGLETGEPTLTI